MKDSLVQQCLDILKREDIKNEFRLLFKPVIDFILYEINPYIYITIALVFMIFIMVLSLFFAPCKRWKYIAGLNQHLY